MTSNRKAKREARMMAEAAGLKYTAARRATRGAMANAVAGSFAH